MISFENVQEHRNMPFERYVSLKGFSHSFLKSEVNGVKPEFIVSEKMKIGSLVDAILMQADEIDFYSPNFNMCKEFASQIRATYGTLIDLFESQISYTATMNFNGFKLPVCGRLDWLLRGHADIDLKVTSAKNDKEFRNIVLNMGYGNQQWNYARMSGVPKAYILPFSTHAKKCLDIIEIPVTESNNFWQEKILKFGTVC